MSSVSKRRSAACAGSPEGTVDADTLCVIDGVVNDAYVLDGKKHYPFGRDEQDNPRDNPDNWTHVQAVKNLKLQMEFGDPVPLRALDLDVNGKPTGQGFFVSIRNIWIVIPRQEKQMQIAEKRKAEEEAKAAKAAKAKAAAAAKAAAKATLVQEAREKGKLAFRRAPVLSQEEKDKVAAVLALHGEDAVVAAERLIEQAVQKICERHSCSEQQCAAYLVVALGKAAGLPTKGSDQEFKELAFAELDNHSATVYGDQFMSPFLVGYKGVTDMARVLAAPGNFALPRVLRRMAQ